MKEVIQFDYIFLIFYCYVQTCVFLFLSLGFDIYFILLVGKSSFSRWSQGKIYKIPKVRNLSVCLHFMALIFFKTVHSLQKFEYVVKLNRFALCIKSGLCVVMHFYTRIHQKFKFTIYSRIPTKFRHIFKLRRIAL